MTFSYRRFAVTSFLFFVISFAHSQNYYVVVGTFDLADHAQKFAGYVRSLQYNGNYELYKDRNIFYVYVLKSPKHDEAMNLARRLQAETEFKDAWVFHGVLVSDSEMKHDSADATGKTKDTGAIVSAKAPTQTQTLTHADSVTFKSTAVEPVAAVAKDSMAFANIPPLHVRGKLFRFAILTSDGDPLNGEVHHVNFEQGRDIATFKGNRYIDVLNPAHNNPMTIVCGIFGYKEVVHVIDYTEPSAAGDITKDEHDAWIIPFRLERMNKGDVSVMYHVSFYKDAVPMLPASRAELDELVNMMKDNPNYRIKIHGHCNGSNSRRIIALGNSKNYFSVKGSKEINGTARDLSRLRAEAVQSYLIDHGIDILRTSIYAWGAMNMLVDEHSSSSKLNDRIEIEIMAD